jgi:hypothetical protein
MPTAAGTDPKLDEVILVSRLGPDLTACEQVSGMQRAVLSRVRQQTSLALACSRAEALRWRSEGNLESTKGGQQTLRHTR